MNTSLCNCCKGNLEDDYIVCDCGVCWCSVRCARKENYKRTKKKSSCNNCRFINISDHFLFEKKK